MARVIRVPVQDEIKRLESHLSEMERKYGMSTEAMAKAAWEDHSLDTPEVGLWLTNYQELKMLRDMKSKHEAGATTGSPSKTT
jgi:hypothetical protein